MSESQPKVIQVTSSQVAAAQAVLKLDEVLGRESDPAVELIAHARKVYVFPDGRRVDAVEDAPED